MQRSVAPRFLAALQTAFSSIAAAMRDPALLRSPLEELGPLADREQFDRVMSFIENAERAHEATLLVGGRRVGEKGYYVEPTLFVDPRPDADIYRREIFGPVGVVRTFETEQEAICEANDSFYGLSSNSYCLLFYRDREMANMECSDRVYNIYSSSSPRGRDGGGRDGGSEHYVRSERPGTIWRLEGERAREGDGA